MRTAVLVVALAGLGGCQLYFGEPAQHEDAAAGPPIIIDAYGSGGPIGCPSDHGPPDRAPAQVYRCAQEQTACTSAGEGATEGCAALEACAGAVAVGQCTCTTGAWSCAPACFDGQCSAAAVQAALVGSWEGIVSPPSFSSPWTVHLDIGADGTWRGAVTGPCNHQVPFYYGGTGGQIVVQGQTDVGAFAAISIGFGSDTLGVLEGLQVTPDTLQFTFVDAWLSCTRRFAYELHRVP